MADILDNQTSIKLVEIILEKNFQGRQPDFNDFDAVFAVVSRMDKITRLIYKDFNYMLNTHDPIEVATEILFQMQSVEYGEKSREIQRIVIRLWTDTLSIRDLQRFVTECRASYETMRDNRLGGEKYYFDQTTSVDTRSSTALCFDRKRYTTNRRFDNVFFEEKHEVQKRVNLFKNNKAWYDKRGIPHTMGFMFSGAAGTGKCLAAGTPVVRADGAVMAVEKIKVGDMLLGDNNNTVRVEAVDTGVSQMYRVDQVYGDSYTVNREHILTLQLNRSSIVTWIDSRSQYKLQWFETDLFVLAQRSFTVRHVSDAHTHGTFATRELAFNALNAFRTVLETDVQFRKTGSVCDISIDEYMSRSPTWQGAFGTARAAAVIAWHAQIDEINGVSPEDAYQHGRDTARTPTVVPVGAARAVYQSVLWLLGVQLETTRVSPVLRRDVMLASPQTRAALLAGFLDGAGIACSEGFRYTHHDAQVVGDMEFVARSLGYIAHAGVLSPGRARICDIPVRTAVVRTGEAIDPRNTSGVCVRSVGSGVYYGFTLSGNGRFVLGDWTVTHNTSTIKAISFECDCDAIINVRLGDVRTNTQLNNLFYSNVLHVVNPDTLNVEKVTVPINKRLYVVEDIDAMGDLIMRRDLKFEERRTQVRSKPEIDLDKVNIDDYLQEAMSAERNDMETEKLEEEENMRSDKINLSALLNILDGTLENPGRIIVFTTNHPEVIDPALIRPGRIDLNITFKLANREIIRQMFSSFYDMEFHVDRFRNIPDYKLSPAVINQVLFRNFDKPDEAVLELQRGF